MPKTSHERWESVMKSITIHRLYKFGFGINRWTNTGFRYSIRLGFFWVRVA